METREGIIFGASRSARPRERGGVSHLPSVAQRTHFALLLFHNRGEHAAHMVVASPSILCARPRIECAKRQLTALASSYKSLGQCYIR